MKDRKLGFSLWFAMSFFITSADALEPEYRGMVETVIQTFRSGDPGRISTLITYPLRRTYPIPPINSPAEFISRFSEVFDDRLIQMIADSDIQNDWSSVGSRGIMLSDGTIWLDHSGRIIAVNYESAAENQIESELNSQQKATLHESLQHFEKPVLDWKTAKFHIRIDDLGNQNYRYASWPVNKSPAQKPDLVLSNGKLVYEGSGGNHAYEFQSGPYRYRCYVSVLGSYDSPPGTLEVFKAEKLLLTQPVIEVLGQ